MAWRMGSATGLERWRVLPDEWVTVQAGFVMVIAGAVLAVDGVVRLDGAVKVG